MLDVRSLSKEFKGPEGRIKALDNVSFIAKKGEVLALIGPSGAGKSTALRSLNLLERPDSGAIFLDEQDLLKISREELRATRQKIGMIFQHFYLLANRTVEDNVALALDVAGWKKIDAQKRVAEVLEIVGLSDKAKAFPAKLSGGQKQRVAIARSIA
ncbi:MAG: ATP-binding cassette domain-containing protein, partial [Proteobacteria bacterium]